MGNRIAIAFMGPIPGSIPMMVPRKHPINTRKAFKPLNATENPCINRSNIDTYFSVGLAWMPNKDGFIEAYVLRTAIMSMHAIERL